MSSDKENSDKRIAAGAAIVAVAALGAAGAFWAFGGDDEPTTAEATPVAVDATTGAGDEVEPPTADATGDEPENGDVGADLTNEAKKLPLPEDCHLHVNRAILASDPKTAAGFDQIGIVTKSISPAQAVGENSHALSIRNTTRVDCALTQGVVGMRGGISFSLGEQTVELRRARLDLRDGTLVVYPTSTGSRSFVGSRIDPDEIERIESPGEVTVIVPMTFTEELSAAFNTGLGQPLAVGGAVIGSLTVTASKHDDPLKTPDAHN